MKSIKFLLCIGTMLIALVTTVSAQPLTVLHDFAGDPSGVNPDGKNPYGGLAFCTNTLFGGTMEGDSGNFYNEGVLYSLSPNGSNYALLHSFGGVYVSPYDGTYMLTTPIVTNGAIYATCNIGGTGRYGTIFSCDTSGGNYTNLHEFGNDSGGEYPQGDLVLSGNSLYGTTQVLGTVSPGGGTVYSMSVNGSNFTVLHTFLSDSNGNSFDGYGPPFGPLVLSSNTLYGVTTQGGSNNQGAIFSVTTDGNTFTRLHSFTTAEGYQPVASMTISSNTLYGTTSVGGPNGTGNGSIFAVNIDGSNFRILHYFTNAMDGAAPQGTLLLSSNVIYGTTATGGSGHSGTIFSINTDGSDYSILYAFTATGTIYPYTNVDGQEPEGSLLLNSNILSGTTFAGGSSGVGTIWTLQLPPPFFNGRAPTDLSGNYYLAFPDSTVFGYFYYQFFPYLYHYDMGFEYFFDANDGQAGAYFYDFTSQHFWYTNPQVFPYVYDFSRGAWLYYYPDTQNPGHYTSNPRYFYNFGTSQIITQ